MNANTRTAEQILSGLEEKITYVRGMAEVLRIAADGLNEPENTGLNALGLAMRDALVAIEADRHEAATLLREAK